MVDASVRTDAHGKPRGFGFVTFSTEQPVTDVLQSGPHTIDGKVVDPKPVVKIMDEVQKRAVVWVRGRWLVFGLGGGSMEGFSNNVD